MKCAEVPVDPAIAPVVANMLLAEEVLKNVPNPNMEPGAGELPQENLRALFDLRIYQLAPMLTHAGAAGGALLVAFQRQTVATEDTRVVPVPAPAFECLLRRGDTIVLSAAGAQHLTTFYGFDALHEFSFLLDPWPKDFNIIRGEVVHLAGEPTLVKVRWADLRSAIMRAETIPTAANVKAFITNLAATSEGPQRSMQSILLAFGDNYSFWHTDQFVDQARAMYEEARKAALDQSDEEKVGVASSRLFGSLLTRMFRGYKELNKLAVSAARREMEDLKALVSWPVLLSELHGRRLCSIAAEAFFGKRYGQVIYLLDLSKEYGDQKLEAATLRILALRGMGQNDEANRLSLAALKDLQSRAEELQREINAESRVFSNKKALAEYRLSSVRQMANALAKDLSP
jgi:hypothetical protein